MDQAYFGWGWNPVLLIICLVITFGIAFLARNSFPVLWVLPAIVLFYGFDWGFPYDGWFKWIFWGLIIFTIVTAIFRRFSTMWSRVPLYYTLGIFLLVWMLMAFSALDPDMEWEWDQGTLMTIPVPVDEDSDPDLTPDSPTETVTETVSPSPQPTATETVTVTPSPLPSPSASPSPQDNGDEEREESRRYDGQIPSIPEGTCPGLLGWDTLVECVEENDLQWYIDGVNARADDTGFDWSDVQLWADARTVDGKFPEVRYIQVFGNRVSDDQAIAWAREQVVEDLRVVRQASCFDNTEGIPGGRLQDFYYCPLPERQMRISLMPLQLNENGVVVDVLDTESGVFVDCLNVWWSRDRTAIK